MLNSSLKELPLPKWLGFQTLTFNEAVILSKYTKKEVTQR